MSSFKKTKTLLYLISEKSTKQNGEYSQIKRRKSTTPGSPSEKYQEGQSEQSGVFVPTPLGDSGPWLKLKYRKRYEIKTTILTPTLSQTIQQSELKQELRNKTEANALSLLLLLTTLFYTTISFLLETSHKKKKGLLRIL